MKRILIFIFLILSLQSFGQNPTNYTRIASRYRWISGMFDSTLYVPRYNGTPSGVRVNETSVIDGMIAMDTTNNRLYIYSGGAWIRLAKYSEIGSTPTLQQVTELGNSTDQWIKLLANNDEPVVANGVVIGSTGNDTLVLSGVAAGDAHINISSLTSERNYRFPDSSGTIALNKDYYTNPSEWLLSKSMNNPVISHEDFTPDPLTEHTQYAPSPIIAWDGNLWNYVKGDGYEAVSVYKSTDKGEVFTFIDTVIVPRASTYYSASATMPCAVADSTNGTIHLYFQALQSGVTPNRFSIGKSSAPFNDPSNVTVASTPLITYTDFKTQTGITYEPGLLCLSSVIKTDSIYFFGSYWDGNADNPSGDLKIFMGSSNTWDTIYNCRTILSPSAPYNSLIAPTVFYWDGSYKMILTEGYKDDDSIGHLISASPSSSEFKNWSLNSGVVLGKGKAGTWEEKRVYRAQVLKENNAPFKAPYFFKRDTTYGGPYYDNYDDWVRLFYSGSNYDVGPYHDETGLAYLAAQLSTDDYYVSKDTTNQDLTVINRNTSHVFNIPDASSTVRGVMTPTLYDFLNSRAPSVGSSNYIQNKSATSSAQTSSSFNISDSAHIGKVLMVGGNTTSLYSLNVNANVGTGGYAGMRLYNSGNGGKEFYWQIDPSGGEISHGGIGNSGSYTLASFASGMLWQSAYWRWRENQSPFNYIFEIDGSSSNRIYAVPSAGRIGIGTYTTDSTLTGTSFHFTGNGRIDGNVGIGTNAPSAKLHVISTTEQLRAGYDASNYYSTTVGSSGTTTLDAVGSGSRFVFSDGITLPAGASTATVGSPLKFTTGTSLSTAEAGAMEYSTPQLFFTNGAALRQELFQGQQSRVSTQFDATSTTTLANITGLTANVAAGKTYRFEAKLHTSSNVAGGVKVAIAGTATATNIIYEGLTTDAGLTTQSRGTALATAVGAVTAVTAAYITITGTITVNAAGTLTVQFAQNASNGTASSVLVGSTFVVTEIL